MDANTQAGDNVKADSTDGFHIHFTAANFRPQYQRNNKKGGLKNLRCFPNCCSGTHATTGFCGGSVLVGVRPEHVRGRRQLAIYAEFCSIVDGRPQGHASLHDTFTQAQIHDLSNKDLDVHAPWYTGDVLQGSHEEGYIYSINTFKRGWHYGWTSNRHTSITQHVLCVYAFELQGSYAPGMIPNDAVWTCICASPSPQFQLYCRRRAKARTSAATKEPAFEDDDDDDAAIKVESPDDYEDDNDSVDYQYEPSKRHRRSQDVDGTTNQFDASFVQPHPVHVDESRTMVHRPLPPRHYASADREFLLPPSCVMEIPELVDFCKMQD
ncbi:hypothetical protein H310_11969 [Aphanomyces invadans]|uniref:Uncharacterized protein n=1 Tax=Aphanomyces invadans TaxID=157072 RepID=A0A024TJK5_9STRA|nr:hypothetical protein H310_11969 [Aphanomyces invadans]ETV94320.1 hypothetical protein H310_11969 [Aphanomyces invadans]|eukprot:XP_008877082.1 hypothetical protein H310_11969 [Aphanomyces invadans]